jgi:hypothetical protein
MAMQLLHNTYVAEDIPESKLKLNELRLSLY